MLSLHMQPMYQVSNIVIIVINIDFHWNCCVLKKRISTFNNLLFLVYCTYKYWVKSNTPYQVPFLYIMDYIDGVLKTNGVSTVSMMHYIVHINYNETMMYNGHINCLTILITPIIYRNGVSKVSIMYITI